ncbi:MULTISPECIES: DUF6941 family protein [Acidithiobacillus]|jgi:hypothetical protein|uniref:DUF6941 family protein n=1 Tax=Acidithiobacillus TaxID=119977 RepID=UPI00059F26AD|nr:MULTISPECIES: hypothetical protein [Acidithiobacillus]MBN6744478.1 hypothetical protein [Acidithiobacillus sp. MC2.2]MBN6747146.1 hypothetical protein [Acidithiobacillus sp. PG05]MCR0968592.1 hypothetical protein [Acidithiobacillus ferrooxidans]MCR1341086.1 hypothetical protein [Acidithiobacillus ferrooxidans]MCR1345404.1 hypothetical protein [Acidithiobacillus ferrooxidans]
MIRAKYSLVAEGACIDGQTGQCSIFSVLDDINAVAFPTFIAKVCFICLWERDDVDTDVKDGEFIINVGDHEFMRNKIKIEFNGRTMNRSIYRVNGIIITEPGIVKFMVKIDNDVSCEYSMNVNLARTSSVDDV